MSMFHQEQEQWQRQHRKEGKLTRSPRGTLTTEAPSSGARFKDHEMRFCGVFCRSHSTFHPPPPGNDGLSFVGGRSVYDRQEQ